MSTEAAPDQNERTLAMAAHLGPVIANLFSAGLIGVLIPLVIYLSKREESPFVADQAKESLNFRITLMLAYLVLTPLAIVLFLTGIFFCLGLLLLFAVWLFELVVTILAVVAALDGQRYRYPFALRLVS